MKANTINGIAEVAAQFVLRGATEYLQRHNLKADPGALAACCRDWARIKLPEALRDAKDALACNMGQAAEQTFALSMMQAGIEAAKECGLPAQPLPRHLVDAANERLNREVQSMTV